MSKFKNLNAVRGISEALLKGNQFSEEFKEVVELVMEEEFVKDTSKFEDINEEISQFTMEFA